MELKYILESILFCAQHALNPRELRDLLATAADQGGATGTASNSLVVVLNWMHLLKRK